MMTWCCVFVAVKAKTHEDEELAALENWAAA